MRMRVQLIFLLPSLFVSGAQRVEAGQATQEQVLAQVQEEARRGNYQLIRPEVIRDRFLKNPNSLVLVDTRQEWEYQREHVERAVNLPVEPTWRTQYTPWSRSAMRKLLGPDKKRGIVFY